MKLRPDLDDEQITHVVSYNDCGCNEDVVYYIDSAGGGYDNNGDPSYFIAGWKVNGSEEDGDNAFYETERGVLWEAVSLDD